jgi:DNA-binding GntR family transcriptional regulator
MVADAAGGQPARPSEEGPIEHGGSAAHAAGYIRWLILTGVLKRGSRVPQDDIAADLGLSRIPIREALVALEHEGWITNLRHRGAFVNNVDEQLVRDHYELFGLLYGYAAEQASKSADATFLDRLVALQQSLLETEDYSEANELARAFHATIVSAADKPRLKVLLRSLSSIVPSGNIFAEVPGTLDIERAGQTAIITALQAGAGSMVAQEYARTMRLVADRVVEFFDRNEIFSDSGAAGSND